MTMFFVPPMTTPDPQRVDIYELQQADIDLDGSPDLTTIRCAFATNQDYVYVYDGGQDMTIARTWQEATDFNNDTWIFDAGGDGNAELILSFMKEAESIAAIFYDDRDGDGHVDYDISGENILIREPGLWTLKVLSDEDWYLSNGYPNQNLRLLFSDNPDTVAGVVDSDHNGVPDYEFWNAYTRSPTIDTNMQHRIWVNEGNKIPAIPEDTLFWPFLIAGERPEIQNKFDTTPIITVDWNKATLDARSIGSNVSGYPIEKGYYVSGLSPLILGELNYINFENPMAYYDLAEDQDGWPELHIRMEYFANLDPYLDVGPSQRALNDIRYSWNQDNSPDLVWDYKVGLVGDHVVDSEVRFSDFGIKTIPYETLPSWINEQTWEFGTLVVNEGGGYPSSEGIYEWSTTNAFQSDAGDSSTVILGSQLEIRNYLTGRSDLSPDRFYHQIRQGLRGEYGFLQARVSLYFSPIDAKLHLLSSQHGVWNLGEGHDLTYANLDGDPYLDQWREQRKGAIVQQLNYCKEIFVYSGNGRVLLKQTYVPLALFEVQPPENYDEWLRLGEQLNANQSPFAPDNFSAMIQQFSGAEMEILEATTRDFRVTPQGFRFVLSLAPGYSFQGEDWLDLSGAASGNYLVTFDGSFQLQALTPAALVVRFEPRQRNPEQSLTAYVNEKILVDIGNQGLEDAQQVLVLLGASQAGGKITWSVPQTVRVLAGETTAVRFEWAPEAQGEWELQAWASLVDPAPAGGMVAAGEQVVVVQAAQGTSLEQEMTAFGVVAPWQVGLLLAALLGTAGLAGWVLTRALGKEASRQSTDPSQIEAGPK